MNVSDAANAMADYIEEHGWCQNQLRDGVGAVCTYGAYVHLGFNGKSSKDYDVLKALSEMADGRTDGFVVHWNDKPGRTKEEVISMLRDVAIKYAPDAMESSSHER